MAAAPTPSGIKLLTAERVLEVRYANGSHFSLPCEYLRVFSPSAEVRGHGLEEPVLVPGKREVNIREIKPVGRYAVRLVFDDGHDTGLYSWEVFWLLGQEQDNNWTRYLARLAEHGMSRERDLVKLSALPKKYTPPKV
ncbi:MAG: DUF971 domain-containing protein [Pseudomonadota bacterium]